MCICFTHPPSRSPAVSLPLVLVVKASLSLFASVFHLLSPALPLLCRFEVVERGREIEIQIVGGGGREIENREGENVGEGQGNAAIFERKL